MIIALTHDKLKPSSFDAGFFITFLGKKMNSKSYHELQKTAYTYSIKDLHEVFRPSDRYATLDAINLMGSDQARPRMDTEEIVYLSELLEDGHVKPRLLPRLVSESNLDF